MIPASEQATATIIASKLRRSGVLTMVLLIVGSALGLGLLASHLGNNFLLRFGMLVLLAVIVGLRGSFTA